MQEVLLLVLKESAGCGVDDGFREAGGAARVEDVERVRGRELGKLEGRVW